MFELAETWSFNDHTHTHTSTHMHTYTHKHTHTPLPSPHTQTPTQTHTHPTPTYTHPPTHTHTHKHTSTPAEINTVTSGCHVPWAVDYAVARCKKQFQIRNWAWRRNKRLLKQERPTVTLWTTAQTARSQAYFAIKPPLSRPSRPQGKHWTWVSDSNSSAKLKLTVNKR